MAFSPGFEHRVFNMAAVEGFGATRRKTAAWLWLDQFWNGTGNRLKALFFSAAKSMRGIEPISPCV